MKCGKCKGSGQAVLFTSSRKCDNCHGSGMEKSVNVILGTDICQHVDCPNAIVQVVYLNTSHPIGWCQEHFDLWLKQQPIASIFVYHDGLK